MSDKCPHCQEPYIRTDTQNRRIFRCASKLRGERFWRSIICNRLHEQQQRLDAAGDTIIRLRKTIGAAMRIKDLWLPASTPIKHKHEATSLALMCVNFEQALKASEQYAKDKAGE